jgi:hypothetical protein
MFSRISTERSKRNQPNNIAVDVLVLASSVTALGGLQYRFTQSSPRCRKYRKAAKDRERNLANPVHSRKQSSLVS